MDRDIFYPNDERHFYEINVMNYQIYPLDMLKAYKQAIRDINNKAGCLVFSVEYDPLFNTAK